MCEPIAGGRPAQQGSPVECCRRADRAPGSPPATSKYSHPSHRIPNSARIPGCDRSTRSCPSGSQAASRDNGRARGCGNRPRPTSREARAKNWPIVGTGPGQCAIALALAWRVIVGIARHAVYRVMIDLRTAQTGVHSIRPRSGVPARRHLVHPSIFESRRLRRADAAADSIERAAPETSAAPALERERRICAGSCVPQRMQRRGY